MKSLQKHIASVEWQIWFNIWIKAILVGVMTSLVMNLILPDNTWLRALFIAPIAILFGFYLGAFKRHKKEALQAIHQQSGNLEFSLELLEKENPSLVERLQLERISKQIPNRIFVFQRGLLPYGIALILITILIYLIGKTDFSSENKEPYIENIISVSSDSIAEKEVLLSASSVKIQSPAYTGISLKSQESLDIKALKGSQITWDLGFKNSDNAEVFIVNSLGEKLPFSKRDGRYLLQENLVSSGIYSIQSFSGESPVFESDFYSIEAIEDKSPQIIPTEKETYKFFFPGNNPKLNLGAQISDDFQVTEVVLVATMARGKGENVKFREMRFPVETRAFQSKQSNFILDVSQLEFQPGDELYYYWSANDNKSPEPNSSRTDTFFIKYFDESDDSDAAMEGMAINVLPEYFRSQRQIIIDTEKLISERKTKAEQEFNYTSNEIGYDQKLLRLRYGQYMGEEFESDAGGASMEGEEGDLLSSYMHLHDQEGEHDPDFKPAEVHEEKHAHEETEESQGGGIESLLSDYMHAHDSEEMNTYFEQSTRGALKSALEQMWQAELHLRLFEPEESLSYQYKALEFLKTVQQKSRVYIKKTGYDPPPIKEEEKRLTGDLEELEFGIQKEMAELEERIEPLASLVLGYLVQNGLNSEEKSKVQELGKLWTERMQNSGLQDWDLLLHLQELEAGKLNEKGRNILKEKLYPFAKNYKSVGTSYLSNQELKKAFQKNSQSW
ncbi:hypothetical protein [Algoriphagus sp. PAP.12]|uniref:hypothetical protein n=1 Tax=Algoriphagus sp. PAP.12 TaxID=2996678 RepID=UPI00227A60CC|nr:hypothetical protein [Algoriphagus sp. PAP.12]